MPKKTADSVHQNTETVHQTVDIVHQIADNIHQTVDIVHQTVDIVHQIADNIHQIADSVHQTVHATIGMIEIEIMGAADNNGTIETMSAIENVDTIEAIETNRFHHNKIVIAIHLTSFELKYIWHLRMLKQRSAADENNTNASSYLNNCFVYRFQRNKMKVRKV